MPPISVLTCPLPIYDQSLGLYPLNPLSSQFSGKNLWNDSVQSSDFKMVKMKAFVQHSSEVYSQHSQNLCTIFMFCTKKKNVHQRVFSQGSFFCYSTQSACFVPHCFRKQKVPFSKMLQPKHQINICISQHQRDKGAVILTK